MKQANQHIHILDTSTQARFGLKGINTLQFMQDNQIVVPAKTNQWLMNQNNLILRLGSSEFLFEPSDGQPPACFTKAIDADVHPIIRADAVFTLTGNGCEDLLAEVCAIDLQALFHTEPQSVIMTSMAGISAMLIRQTMAEHTAYRVWCDASYRHYMQSTLTAVAQDIATVNLKMM